MPSAAGAELEGLAGPGGSGLPPGGGAAGAGSRASQEGQSVPMMIAAIARKEIKDHLRDRRSIISGLLVPLIGPLTTLAMFALIASWMRQDRPLIVPVAGARNAPRLIAFLQRQGAIVETAPADYEQQVREGNLDLALSVPEDYGKEFEAGRSAPLQLIEDSSRNKSHPQVLRARRLLELYVRRMSALRMIAGGVSPTLL